MALTFTILKIAIVIFLPVLIPGLIVGISYIYYMIYFKYIKKMKREKTIIKDKKKYSIFKRLFRDFPKRMAQDFFELNPDRFKEYGVHLVCGPQGSGKTITVCYLLREWSRIYPKMKIYTNMDYRYQSGPINHYKDILKHSNGIFGCVEVLDEIQTWFNSNESKDFPVEMLTEISQQRKQTKAILGTAQVFSRISKPIREQTHFVYIPYTFFGCLTIVRKTKAEYWNEAKQKFRKYTGFFFFVHDKELRDSFDTYKKIQKYKNTGFSIHPQLNESHITISAKKIK